MPSRQSRKSQPAIQSESEEEESQPKSTEQEAAEVLKTAKAIVADGKGRREKKRKEIERDHEKRVNEIKAKIDALFAVRQGRVTKYQKDLWSRLETLNSKREKLEKQILTSMAAIEKHTVNISSEMDAMFKGRGEEIQGKDEDESTKTM